MLINPFMSVLLAEVPADRPNITANILPKTSLWSRLKNMARLRNRVKHFIRSI